MTSGFSSVLMPNGQPFSKGMTGGKTTARYLRDTKSGVIASRRPSLSGSREDIRRSWERSASLAVDLIQNSGRLKGATDQVIADTVGNGLTLTPQPDLSGLGYDEKEAADWCRMVKKRYHRRAKNKSECDFRGKLTKHQQVDIALRWSIAYGEVTGVYEFFGAQKRQRYGVTSGTKLCMVPPHRLVQDTSTHENLYQGVRHDENGRAISYRFKTSENGFAQKQDFAAYDTDGRPLVMHIFDPMDAEDVRGISQLAPAFRKHIQSEMLGDATLQMSILQTIFAITLTSDTPSADAFEAIEALKDAGDGGKDLSKEYMGYLGSQLDHAAESRINVGADPQVSHLGPGETLDLKAPQVNGADFEPFSKNLDREMARTIGITYGGFTMDYTAATYASTRMENSSIWPIVTRRRERIAAPVYQTDYELWLEEEIAEKRIPFKGGYRAFWANQDRICPATWQGPAKPTADDHKSARASSERLKNKTTSLAEEAGERGMDADTLFEQQKGDHDRYEEAGMASPYGTTAETKPKKNKKKKKSKALKV